VIIKRLALHDVRLPRRRKKEGDMFRKTQGRKNESQVILAKKPISDFLAHGCPWVFVLDKIIKV